MRKTMKAMQMKNPRGPLELVELDLPVPNDQEVLIQVEVTGVCNGDSVAIEGRAPSYPLIPGHEVIGRVIQLGKSVSQWQLGDRVGIGFHDGHGGINGLTHDGGYAEFMLAQADSLIAIPTDLDAAKLAPLMCAGESTYSALAHSLAEPGDLVAIQGIGGLGHLAVQFAKALGFQVVAISRTAEKEAAIRALGADYYIYGDRKEVLEQIKALGGVKVLLSTVSHAAATSALLPALKQGGQLIVLSASKEAISLPSNLLVGKGLTVTGSMTAGREALEEMLAFSLDKGVIAQVQSFPLEAARKAYEAMKNSQVQFRAVLRIS